MPEIPEGAVPPIRLFYSYAREDEVFRQALDKHLSALKRTGVIAPWHDRRIVPGMDWAREIDKHLEDAHLILLLVSADFLDSDYCWGVEMQRALEMHGTGTARVVPVMVRPVDIEGVPFANLQALPGDAKPITEWRNVDTAWAAVAKGIRAAALDVRDQIRTRAVRGADNRSVPNQPEQGLAGSQPRRVERLDAQALGQLYADYWTKFSDVVANSGLGLRPPTPSTRNYARLSLRSSVIRMNAFASVRDRLVGVELVLARPATDATIARLQREREEIERGFGQKLEWNNHMGSVRIALSERGCNLLDRADWARQHDWLIETIKAYQQILLGRIENL